MRWSMRRISPSLKAEILDSGLTTSELVTTAWASAATFRGTDMRGGANGARIRLAPQKDWAVNNPQKLAKVLKKLEDIQKDFNKAQSGGKKISLADLIVLGGSAAIEDAAKKAGQNVQVPFKPGRTDASQAQTDVNSFAVLEPTADGFRNYFGEGNYRSPAEMLVDKANLLTLTVPEMTVLVGGMRALDANRTGCSRRIYRQPGDPEQRFLRESARHVHRLEQVVCIRRRLRGSRSCDRRAEMDRHPGGSYFRF